MSRSTCRTINRRQADAWPTFPSNRAIPTNGNIPISRQPGYDIYVEAQNSFQLRELIATISSRPDLIVNRGKDALIIDVKTGQEQPWHTVQLQIYQYALPKALPERFRHARLAGEVVYPSRIARVSRGTLPGQFIHQLGSTIRRLTAPNPPKPTTSFHECRFCDITAADCPKRVDQPDEIPRELTSDF